MSKVAMLRAEITAQRIANRDLLEDLAETRAERDAALAEIVRKRLALENVKALAKRMRHKGDAESVAIAGHLLRFCEQGGHPESVLDILRSGTLPPPGAGAVGEPCPYCTAAGLVKHCGTCGGTGVVSVPAAKRLGAD